ncbi:MAG: nuclease-related domain-containing protein [Verrucomicrobiota bacterium JB025]|nr:nuclease-related domain-containing protein [Verrucomicrobiota bacterium JB025]
MPRPAGWSLQTRSEAILLEITILSIMAVTFGFLFWVLGMNEAPARSTLTLTGLITSGGFFIMAATKLKCMANHNLGLRGEQITGQYLDRLSSTSVHVFHDLEVREPGCKPWNIDHIVVTPEAVYAIETKARRKPLTRTRSGQNNHEIIYDGKRLTFPAPMGSETHGIDQARASAKWLSATLSAHLGESIPVKPILVFPGWWIEAIGKGPVTVLNPKRLSSLMRNPKPLIPKRLQSAIAHHLYERTRIDLSA